MARWDWLTQAKTLYTRSFVMRVILKAAVLFIGFNAMFVLLTPMQWINQATLYNTVFPGRERLAYSDNPKDAYNISLGSLDAMFASHVISNETRSDVVRVAMIGDSSVWGVLLDNDETLSSCLNAMDLRTDDGHRIEVYNLGYPVLSVLKDVLILDQALDHDIDAVVWLTTLQALFETEQLRHPILSDNADVARDFIERYNLDLNAEQLPQQTLWYQTIIGQRRVLSDWLRYQIYGLGWWMTGEDYASAGYLGAPVRNLPASENVLNQPQIEVGNLIEQNVLAWDVMQAGFDLVDEHGVPMLLVNEPIFRSDGLNSDIRYNEYYPRWAYDAYRQHLEQLAAGNNWPYLDLWNFVPAESFTDTPFHYEAGVVCDVAAQMVPDLLALIN